MEDSARNDEESLGSSSPAADEGNADVPRLSTPGAVAVVPSSQGEDGKSSSGQTAPGAVSVAATATPKSAVDSSEKKSTSRSFRDADGLVLVTSTGAPVSEGSGRISRATDDDTMESQLSSPRVPIDPPETQQREGGDDFQIGQGESFTIGDSTADLTEQTSTNVATDVTAVGSSRLESSVSSPTKDSESTKVHDDMEEEFRIADEPFEPKDSNKVAERDHRISDTEALEETKPHAPIIESTVTAEGGTLEAVMSGSNAFDREDTQEGVDAIISDQPDPRAVQPRVRFADADGSDVRDSEAMGHDGDDLAADGVATGSPLSTSHPGTESAPNATAPIGPPVAGFVASSSPAASTSEMEEDVKVTSERLAHLTGSDDFIYIGDISDAEVRGVPGTADSVSGEDGELRRKLTATEKIMALLDGSEVEGDEDKEKLLVAEGDIVSPLSVTPLPDGGDEKSTPDPPPALYVVASSGGIISELSTASADTGLEKPDPPGERDSEVLPEPALLRATNNVRDVRPGAFSMAGRDSMIEEVVSDEDESAPGLDALMPPALQRQTTVGAPSGSSLTRSAIDEPPSTATVLEAELVDESARDSQLRHLEMMNQSLRRQLDAIGVARGTSTFTTAEAIVLSPDQSLVSQPQSQESPAREEEEEEEDGQPKCISAGHPWCYWAACFGFLAVSVAAISGAVVGTRGSSDGIDGSVPPFGLPSAAPSLFPVQSSAGPSIAPSSLPSTETRTPTVAPSNQPSGQPSSSSQPSERPSLLPSLRPSVSAGPSMNPSSAVPSSSREPSPAPSVPPSLIPSSEPSDLPSEIPSVFPSIIPTAKPSQFPTVSARPSPTLPTTPAPSPSPTSAPRTPPSSIPSNGPTSRPTRRPISSPTNRPTKRPTEAPTLNPTGSPIARPTSSPINSPTRMPIAQPTRAPIAEPTRNPTRRPTPSPTTSEPTESPIAEPTPRPTTAAPTDPIVYKCFEDRSELRLAILEYISDPKSGSIVARTYGHPIGTWCVGAVTDFSDLFQFQTDFNDDISTWDMSSAVTLNSMFNSATSFNQDLSNWDVSNVKIFSGMFANTRQFNGEPVGRL